MSILRRGVNVGFLGFEDATISELGFLALWNLTSASRFLTPKAFLALLILNLHGEATQHRWQM